MFDVLIIGAGPAGVALAYALKAKNQSVAVVERFLWGGVCPNFGCDPTKAMMAVVEAKHRVADLAGQGISGDLTIDWAGLRGRKINITDPYEKQTLDGFKASGITTFYGDARFTTDGKVQVADEVIEAKKVVIATGTRARKLSIPGGELMADSNDFLLLDVLPETMIFVGTGPVTLELAQIAHAAGADVTVIAAHGLAVPHFDRELADSFLSRLKADGIHFEENIAIEKVEKTADGKLRLTGADGFALTSDYIVAGVGRLANVESLGLENVGVETDRGGILVNEFLQTANPDIYAMGDVLSKALGHLTPVSSFEADYLGHELDAENPTAIDYPVIPSVVYGPTKLAEVGVLSGDGLRLKTLDMTNWYSYKRISDPLAKAKIAMNAAGEIVGASVVSTVAEELINLITLLIETKVAAGDIQKFIMAYPTIASDLEYLY